MKLAAPGVSPAAIPGDGIQPATSAEKLADDPATMAGLALRSRRYSRMSMALIVLATIASIAALYFARAFFIPLLIGILTSYTLRPVVDKLQALRMPRPVAAAFVMAVLIGSASWIAYSLSAEVTVIIEKLPEAARKLRQNLSPTQGTAPTALQNVQEAAKELQSAASEVGKKPVGRVAPVFAIATKPDSWVSDYALAQSALLMSVMAQAPVVLLLAYFLLASGDHFRRKLVQLVGPSLTRKKDALRILEEIDTQVQRYLFLTLTSNTLVGIGTWLAFEAIGMEQAGIWGVFAGVVHFVPYLGSVLVAIAVGVAAFLQYGTLLHALAVAGMSAVIAGMIGMIFMTWLQSRYARLNAAVLFIALLFFGWLWGIAGMLLGAPLVAIAKVICDRVDALKPAGELLGK